jgi:1-acyl-sn-glycerol-3-phosphate acyltransferase
MSLPRQEPFVRALGRRAITIPLFALITLLVVAISPAVFLVGLVLDVARRRRFATLRAWAMVDVFFLCEMIGVARAAWIRVRYREREAFINANYRLEFWWAGTLYRAGMRLFSLKLEIEGADAAAEGPILVFSRHVSPIDNLLPVALISLPFQSRLRWVINRSLLRDPCIDIVGNRLPNCFVSNSSGDSGREISRVEALGRGLGPGEGVLIFPEGGLFTPSRRERVIERMAANGETVLLDRARRMQHVLPPRLGGALALLAAAEGADAVFLAHTGLERATEYSTILHGDLIGRTISVKMWRVAAAEIPAEEDARASWLLQQWQSLDDWIAMKQEGPNRA